MRTKHRVSQKYLAWLVLSLAAVFLVAAAFIAVQEYRTRSRELEQKADRTALLTALLFQNPIWNLDGTQIQQNMDALTLDPEIAAITVTAASSGDMAKHPDRIRPGLLVRKVVVTDPVNHASRIGEVTLYLSQDVLLHKVRLRVLGLAVVMLLGLATMTTLHGLIHRRVITGPLDDLLDGILRNSEGRPFQPVRVRSEDEIGQLGQAFNTMMRRLRAYQEDLEGMVAQRVKQLLHAQQLLSATLDALPVFIAILDEHHTILATNQKWAACGPGNPFIAQARVGSAYPALCETVARERAGLAGTASRISAMVARAEGSERLDYDLDTDQGHRCFTMLVKPFATDEASHVVLLHEDITLGRTMEAQLRQAQKLEAIGHLAAGIAHEINTPTQFIGDNIIFLREAFDSLLRLSGPLEDLLEAARRNEAPGAHVDAAEQALRQADLEFLREEVPKAIAQSLEGVGRVARIVSAMKDFSHPGETSKVPTDLNRAIESTALVCRSEWKHVAALELELDPALPLVPCLPDEFNQVVLNLIINAVHAISAADRDGAPAKGRIRITTRTAGDHAEIQVEDTGSGIPEAIRGLVFEPFFTTKEVGKGTGQGLAIAYSVIVDKHGGSITFDSELGKGTRFLIRLPLAQPG